MPLPSIVAGTWPQTRAPPRACTAYSASSFKLIQPGSSGPVIVSLLPTAAIVNRARCPGRLRGMPRGAFCHRLCGRHDHNRETPGSIEPSRFAPRPFRTSRNIPGGKITGLPMVCMMLLIHTARGKQYHVLLVPESRLAARCIFHLVHDTLVELPSPRAQTPYAKPTVSVAVLAVGKVKHPERSPTGSRFRCRSEAKTTW